MRDEAKAAYEAWLKATHRIGPTWRELPFETRTKWDRATQATMRELSKGDVLPEEPRR